ncbi:LysR family transcriptional regulator [Pigmentiphaga sp. GD03639]|uniref:LysR family transcriptional regulator n=1 Tax=Pigmentiphaga daeguensis TaxID=414049 RepID=A0ABN1D128_9BURK|nr:MULTISPECIES: LysR family transcriptional regulator [unclassified Pigmentiphaga]MDH2238046.1 LysR family transcriptional regulator [Pigmentiphaga sp. GD03639]
MNFVHIHQLELTQLQLLDALRTGGSVSKAADALGLTQSAASHSLARLRRTLGDPLFVRTPGGMVPTPRGARIADAARSALATLGEALRDTGSFDPATAERIFRVYMNEVGQMVMLPRLLDHLRRHAPGIALKIGTLPDHQPGALLESGEVDLAVGHITALSAGFHQRLLFHEHYVCAVSPDHPRFAAGMTEAGFREARHAVTGTGAMAHRVVEEALRRHGIVRRIGLEAPEFIALPFIIPSSDLVVTMPSGLADQLAGAMPLRILPPPVPLPSYEIRMFWHERAHHDAANVWLRQLFAELFRQPRAAS